MAEDSKEIAVVKPIEMTEYNSAYGRVVDFAKNQMKNDVDYGVIPGTKNKSLLKPGAEKLGFLFGLKPKFELIKEIENFETGMFFYKYRCILVHFETGKFAGEAIRSCNSMEKKYAWITKNKKWATQQEIANAVEEFQKKDGQYTNTYIKIKKSPEEQAEQANTIDAMAQKRALVAATVHATMATEIFDTDFDSEFENEAPNRSTTKEEDPRRANVTAKLFAAGKERGFPNESLKELIYRKLNVTSLTQLSTQQLEEMYEKVVSQFVVVKEGERPQPVSQTKKEVQEAEIVTPAPQKATDEEQASLMSAIYAETEPAVDMDAVAEAYEKLPPEDKEKVKEVMQEQLEKETAEKKCYNKKAHPNDDVFAIEGENFCSPECKEEWSNENYQKKGQGKSKLDAIIAKKKAKEGDTTEVATV